MRWGVGFPALVAAFLAEAAQITVPTLPPAPYADTEISTNVAFNLHRSDVRTLDLQLQLDGSPSNNVQIAFGRDANGNGALDREETDAVYGWRGGRCFAEDARGWERIEGAPPSGAGAGAVSLHLALTPGRRPARCLVTGPGMESFAGFASAAPEWLYRPEWNMLRVVRRGPGPASEWLRCDIGYESFVIRVR